MSDVTVGYNAIVNSSLTYNGTITRDRRWVGVGVVVLAVKSSD